MLLLRDSLLLDPSPMMSLRPEKLPPLDAPTLLALAFELIPLLPADLYKEVSALSGLNRIVQSRYGLPC